MVKVVRSSVCIPSTVEKETNDIQTNIGKTWPTRTCDAVTFATSFISSLFEECVSPFERLRIIEWR
jgi:hypothetical protein